MPEKLRGIIPALATPVLEDGAPVQLVAYQLAQTRLVGRGTDAHR